MNGICSHHEAVEARQQVSEKDRNDLWEAVNTIRRDIQSLVWKIGFIVGGITALNSFVMILIGLK